MENKDIAIVGMSCFAPGAHNIDEFWNNLINGVDSIINAPADRIDPVYFEKSTPAVDRFYCKRGGFIPDILFDPLPYSILPLAVEGMDTAHMLALKLVYKALEDASVFEKKIPLNKSALIIGKGNYVGSAIWRAIDIVHVGEQLLQVIQTVLPDLSKEELDKIKKEYQASRGRYQADSMPGLIPNLIASLIANKLDMQGPAYTIDAACASSLIALDNAIKELHSKRCDIAIAGGIHDGQNATFWSIFSQLGALSHKQKITPFNEDADGLLIGDGGGFVVLKTLKKAVADNDRIYAVIKGVGVSSDGSGVSVMAPAMKGQKLAIEEAWKNSGLNPQKLGYIEAHGTATVVGDRTELSSLAAVFPNEDGAGKVLIGSVKSNIGHTMPAAGILGLIKTTLALYNRQIPPTLHCDRPLKDMEKTRFRPAQKLEEWDGIDYPLVAGVNAFGFGGINAHVVLEAYGEKKKTKNIPALSFIDQVLVLSAPTKEALINALKSEETSSAAMEGDYRLVIFNPTADRIETAINLISKDIVWKGRQDIWFTNEPLLKNGGKVAFLYPGFDPSSNPEIDSLINYFGISIPEDKDEYNVLLNHTLKLYRSSEIMNKSLKMLDVKSDMNVGHSLGEWFGIRASGMVSADTVKAVFKSLDPEQYKVSGMYFVAVGCGKEKLEPIMKTIPDIYLSNDNCPNQVLLCVKEEALQPLLAELQKEQIFHQQLSFQSGFHSPFIKDKVHILKDTFRLLKFNNPETPMWSASTLAIYPQHPQDIKKLSVKHLLETVRFRELIEKIYNEENVRVFIQVGAGSLVGFTDDTLKNKKYGAVSLTSGHHSTLEQLRRVLALLYIEGKKVNLAFLNANIQTKAQTASGKEMKLQMSIQTVKKFPLLSKLSEKYKIFQSVDITSLSVDRSHPVLMALNENMREMALIQSEISKLVGSSLIQNPLQAKATKELISVPAPIQKKTNKIVEEDLHISLSTHPSVIDHSLVKQPSYWTEVEDLSPVIPMTMTVELFGEAAHKQDLTKKIGKIGPISVFQWLEVHNPFIQKISGVWKSEELISLGIKNFASAEVSLCDSYAKPDTFYENYIDLGESIRPFPSKPEIYKKYMFHGPEYQGIEKVTDVTEKGIRAFVRKGEGKGSLLDNVGQVYALHLQLTLDKNIVSFPVKIQEIKFYQDMHDQEGLFECVCLIREIGDTFTSSDIVVKRDNKIWCVIEGWKNQRFEFDDRFWQMTLNPGQNFLAHKIESGVFFYDNAYEKSYTWNFLVKQYLNKLEKKHHKSLPLNKQKDYLISRIALKDNVRSYVQNIYDRETFPIELSVRYDSNHKPSIYGIDEVENLEISIAHKGSNAVSIVSEKPVGIDIETIEERTEDFMDLSFTDHEMKLLKAKNQAEWTTRFWVAKEAYGKMLGLGLQGNPKRYEVKEILDDENLVIENCGVRTIKYKNFIIGWTK